MTFQAPILPALSIGGTNDLLSPLPRDPSISILKNFAKTLFNKISNNTDSVLTPLEKAKFDSAQAMLRDGKTTRYAYYKYKKLFEQPLLESLKKTLKENTAFQGGGHIIYDEALRKVAGFIDKLDQKKLQALQDSSPERYADFIGEAYLIANDRGGRSKSKNIRALLEQKLHIQAPPQRAHSQDTFDGDGKPLDLNKTDLLALIEKNIDSGLNQDEIAKEMLTLAENIRPALKELTCIIKSMPEADRKADGISERCFYLFGDFVGGINTSNVKSLNTTSDMMTFMSACFTDHMPEMITELKLANQSRDHYNFLSKYAPVLIKTYQFLLQTGYLSSGISKVDENELVAFIKDVDGAFDKMELSSVKAPPLPQTYQPYLEIA